MRAKRSDMLPEPMQHIRRLFHIIAICMAHMTPETQDMISVLSPALYVDSDNAAHYRSQQDGKQSEQSFQGKEFRVSVSEDHAQNKQYGKNGKAGEHASEQPGLFVFKRRDKAADKHADQAGSGAQNPDG